MKVQPPVEQRYFGLRPTIKRGRNGNVQTFKLAAVRWPPETLDRLHDLRRRDPARDLFGDERLQLGVASLRKIIDLVFRLRLGKLCLEPLHICAELGDLLVVFEQGALGFGPKAAGLSMAPQPAEPQNAANNEDAQHQRDIAFHLAPPISFACFEKIHAV